MRIITIKENDSEQRADRFLQKHLPRANKNFLMKMLRKKNITRNKARLRPDDILQIGDSIEFFFSDETYESFRPKERRHSKSDFRVVYEDDSILIVDKPPGLLSHTAQNLREKNLLDGVLHYLQEKGEYSPRSENSFVPALANRLDRNTAGLVLIGKNSATLKELNSFVKTRSIRKIYWAIVEGKCIYSGSIQNTFSRNEKRNISTLAEGKQMESIVKPLEISDSYTMMEVELITGRTHQIRLQLASIGHSIAGDRKYGASRDATLWPHQQLVAVKILFPEIEKGPLQNMSNRSFHSKYGEKMLSKFREVVTE